VRAHEPTHLQQPSAFRQPVDLERPRRRVHEPEVGDAFPSVDRHLLGAVQPLGARRHDLAHPIRSDGEEWDIGELRHPLTPPRREVRHEHVATEMELGSEELPPAVAAAAAVAEPRAQIRTENRSRERRPRTRPRRDTEISVDDLGDPVVRSRQEVFVGGATLDGRGHRTSLAPPLAGFDGGEQICDAAPQRGFRGIDGEPTCN
jgi:hypothetical protein